MSGDKIRRAAASDPSGKTSDERTPPLAGGPDRPLGQRDSDPLASAQHASADDAVADGTATVDDGLVTESLDEILLAMIASNHGETHGTGLMNRLDDRFDVDLSPGTVYPRLHELESAGVLDVHELVQTKQYSVCDEQTAAERIERAATHHLAIGLFLQASLDGEDRP